MNKITTPRTLALVRQELDNKALVPTLEKDIAEMMAIKAAFDAEWKTTWKALEAYMIDNDIKDIYNLTIAEKKVWKAEGQLPPRFYKQTLDTSRLNFAFTHGDTLPKNVGFTTTQYLTKTNRKVEA